VTSLETPRQQQQQESQPVVGTCTIFPVTHLVPPHHLKPGSALHTFAPRIKVAVSHHQFRISARTIVLW